MGPQFLDNFRKFLIESRKRTDHNHLSVQKESKSHEENYGRAFYVHNTTIRKYEQGGMPSPPKLLTLARIYGTPVGEFFRALGASDEEICECHKTLPANTQERQTVTDVLEVLRTGDKLAIETVRGAIALALKREQRSG
jgi:transcriptional regulator with XRE-family HTH domain